MCSVVPAPAQIFGLIQMQSKSNPSAQKGCPHNPIIPKSSYVKCNTNKPLRSTLVICSFWSISIYFSPLGLLQSIQFTLVIHSFQSILVHFGPLGTLQSIQSFCSIRSTLVSLVQSIQSFWSTLVYQVHFGPIQSILSTSVYCSQTDTQLFYACLS